MSKRPRSDSDTPPASTLLTNVADAVAQLETHNRELQDRAAQLEADNTRLTTSVDELREHVRHAEQVVTAPVRDFPTVEKIAERLVGGFKRLLDENHRLRDDKTRLEEATAALEAEAIRNAAEIGRLNEVIATQTTTIDQTKESAKVEKEALDERGLRLERQVADLKAEKTTAITELKRVQVDHTATTEGNATLREEKQRIDSVKSTLRREKGDLTRQVTDLSEKIQTLEKSNQKYRKDNATLKSENGRLKKHRPASRESEDDTVLLIINGEREWVDRNAQFCEIAVSIRQN